MRKEYTLEICNERLKDGGSDVRIEKQGRRLYLRATLPHKESPKRTKQYRLSLGLNSSPKTLEIAEARAWELNSLKIQGKFEWKQWDRKYGTKSDKQIWELIDGLHRELQIGRPGKPKEETWEGQYLTAFKRFDDRDYLTEEVLIRAIKGTPPESRQRLHDLIAYKKLAVFAGFEFDFEPYKSTYSSRKRKERKLPTDQEILDAYKALPVVTPKSERWRYVFALIATYGLRPHEAFFCTVSDQHPYTCTVHEGKTGYREVQPLFLEWAEQWQLWNMNLPQIPIKTHKAMGHRVCTMLGAKAGFPIYNLRHAYAIRGIQFGIPDRMMAALMGHSVVEFQRTYSRWLQRFAALEAWKRAQSNPYRPIAPQLEPVPTMQTRSCQEDASTSTSTPTSVSLVQH